MPGSKNNDPVCRKKQKSEASGDGSFSANENEGDVEINNDDHRIHTENNFYGVMPGSVRSIPCQLPERAAKFFGRADHLAELKRRIPSDRTIYVWGPAGMGKTALVAEALHELGFTSRESLARCPFQDGIAFLDLYSIKADPTKAWDYLASSLDPSLPTNSLAKDRATQACRNRAALIIIEGAEESSNLPELLSVLAPENHRLILTRNTHQTEPAKSIKIDHELDDQDSLKLLRSLTENKIADEHLTAIFGVFGGHPLALTWAGSHLAYGEESPSQFVKAAQTKKVPEVHDPLFENHDLHWLYNRSVKGLSENVRKILHAAGTIVAAPFPLSLAVAVVGNEAEAQESLRRLIRNGFLRRAETKDETAEAWEFTHSLAYKYASDTMLDATQLTSLATWALSESKSALQNVRAFGNVAPLRQSLFHAAAVLRADIKSKNVACDGLRRWFMYDGQEEIKTIGRLDLALLAINAAKKWVDLQVVVSNASSKWLRESFVIALKIGDLQHAQGDLNGAAESYRNGLELRAKLVTYDPSNTEWQRNLSIGYSRVGDVQRAQGDLTGAAKFYRTDLEVAARFAAEDPSNTRWQNDLSVSYERVGDVQRAQGDLNGAAKSYRSSLEIAAKLAARDISNTKWQRELSVRYNKVGDVQKEQADLGGAAESYRIGFEMIAKLAASDLSNTVWKRDLAVSHQRVGNVQMAQNDLTGAAKSYRVGLEIITKLAAGDPFNIQWQRDLYVSNYKMADLLEKTNPTDALSYWREAHRILATIKEKGLFVSDGDEEVLEFLRQKIGL